MRICLWLLALFPLVVVFGLADVVHLRDGRTLEGTVTDHGQRITVKMRFGSLSVNKSEVLRIVKKASARQLFEKRYAALAKTDVSGRIGLAGWCKSNKLPREMRTLYREVLALAPDNVAAREALGYVLRGDKWMTHDESMRAAGMVKHEGRWMLKEHVQLIGRRRYVDGAKIGRVVLIDEKSGTIHLTHAKAGGRAVPARISGMPRDGVITLDGIQWPVTTETELSGYPVLLAYRIKLRFGKKRDGRFRLSLARWLEQQGYFAEAAKEAAIAMELSAGLTAEANTLIDRLLDHRIRKKLERVEADWRAGRAASALAQLRKLLAAGLEKLEPKGKELLSVWEQAEGSRIKLLAKLMELEKQLHPTADTLERAFVARLRGGLTPSAVELLSPRLPASPGSREAALEQLRRLDVSLAYRYTPEILELAPSLILAIEAWCRRYRQSASAAERRKLVQELPRTFPKLSIANLALILRQGIRPTGPTNSGVSKAELVIREDGSKTTYQLYTPRGYTPFERWPLLVFNHGKGGDGSRSISRWKSLAEKYRVIICCPTATTFRDKGWGGTRSERSITLSAVAQLRRRMWIDERRIYLAGVSMGAHGAWDIAMHHPDRFAGVFSLLGGPRIKHYRLLPGLRHTAVYGAQGALDDPRLVRGVRYAMTRLETLGHKVRYREEPALGHEQVPGAEADFLGFVSAVHKPDYPKKVALRATGSRHARNYWLQVLSHDRQAMDPKKPLSIPGFRRLAEADRLRVIVEFYEKKVLSVVGHLTGPNRIELTANPHVGKVRVHLAPELVDFSRPLVVTYNGKTAFSGRVKVRLEHLLEEARRNPDRAELYWAAIDVRRPR